MISLKLTIKTLSTKIYLLVPQIKIRGNVESLFKLRTVVLISFLVVILLTERIGSYVLQNTQQTVTNLTGYFGDPNLITFYGTIIGLLMAAYTVMITMIPSFHPESLKQPIFAQINRLFLFTILTGLMMLLLSFTITLIPDRTSSYFIQVEMFFFFSLIIGLIFSVLALSDLFKVVSGRKRIKEIEHSNSKTREISKK
ncbi:MAG: hypothetical protein ACYDAO_02260 [Thermoplasmataceae archaeon]